jgi:hypothetical protein
LCGIEEDGRLVGEQATKIQKETTTSDGLTTMSHEQATKIAMSPQPQRIIENKYSGNESPIISPLRVLRKIYEDPFDGPHPALDKHRSDSGHYESEWDVGLDSDEVDSMSSFSDD